MIIAQRDNYDRFEEESVRATNEGCVRVPRDWTGTEGALWGLFSVLWGWSWNNSQNNEVTLGGGGVGTEGKVRIGDLSLAFVSLLVFVCVCAYLCVRVMCDCV